MLQYFLRSLSVGVTMNKYFVRRCGRLFGISLAAASGVIMIDKLAVNGKVFAAEKVAEHSDWMCQPVTDIHLLKLNPDDIKSKMEIMIMQLQADFCHALETEENGMTFQVDKWQREDPKEGGGITCVMQGGQVLEKAGVNVTIMRAPLSKNLLEHMRARGKNISANEDLTFFAAGISSVIHPRNPHVATIHFNYRYFEILDSNGKAKLSWFGGGTDLTPYYLVEKDVKHFHSCLKKACDRHDKQFYSNFKKWCDKYFFIPHRGECRGIGGIFFDDLEGEDMNKTFKFVKDCADSVIPSYIPLVSHHKNDVVSEEERNWQLLRRGRYVEFNLVYDRGTKFGFSTPNARIESILMSLPLLAKWEYMSEPKPGSNEAKLMQVLKNPKDWL